MCENCQNTSFEKLQAVIDKYKDDKGPLMPVMQEAQTIFGYLPIEVQNFIADALEIPMTDVYGVATFYSQFKLEPSGENTVSVCLGTACYVKGAQDILDKIVQKLKVTEGKTTPDGKFTLLGTRCVGCCGLAPVMMVNDDIYGQINAAQVVDILEKY